jgi:AcrR family transcriptional regulator
MSRMVLAAQSASMSPPADPSGEQPSVQTRLLVAAEGCFRHYGINKTTMDDVARAAGVSRATLYRHFADREALITASIDWRARANIPDAHAHMAQYPTFAEKLVEGLIHNIRRGQHDPVVQLLISGQPALTAQILGGRDVAHELTHELWAPILTAAQTSGELRAGLEIREASTWLARITLMMVAQDEHERLDTDALRHELTAFVVPAFLTPGAP